MGILLLSPEAELTSPKQLAEAGVMSDRVQPPKAGLLQSSEKEVRSAQQELSEDAISDFCTIVYKQKNDTPFPPKEFGVELFIPGFYHEDLSLVPSDDPDPPGLSSLVHCHPQPFGVLAPRTHCLRPEMVE